MNVRAVQRCKILTPTRSALSLVNVNNEPDPRSLRLFSSKYIDAGLLTGPWMFAYTLQSLAT